MSQDDHFESEFFFSGASGPHPPPSDPAIPPSTTAKVITWPVVFQLLMNACLLSAADRRLVIYFIKGGGVQVNLAWLKSMLCETCSAVPLEKKRVRLEREACERGDNLGLDHVCPCFISFAVN